jgi:RNA polymerase sigma-70 factor (ECF subfamily)
MMDQRIFNRAKEGDLDSFKQLVAESEGKVAGILRSLLGPTQEAEDVGQEVYLQAYASLKKLDHEQAFFQYLVRKAVQLVIPKLKNRSKHMGHRKDDPVEAIKSAEYPMDKYEIFNYVFNRMDPDLRIVIVLRLMEGYSVDEISEILEVSKSVVLDRLIQAQQEIRSVLVETVK